MKFSRHDLKQIDDNTIDALPQEQLRLFSKNLLADLKEATARLNQNARNSSDHLAVWHPGEKLI